MVQEAEEVRVDPADGRHRTLAELWRLCAKYYSREDVQAYWQTQCKPVETQITAGSLCVCVDECVVFASATAWERIGLLSVGQLIVAAGPPEMAQAHLMVDLRPTGSTEASKVTVLPQDAKVTMDGQLVGEVRFCGTTKFAPGDWVGVVFEEPVGKNDGSLNGVRYFTCPPNHGIFVRPRRLRRVGGGSVADLQPFPQQADLGNPADDDASEDSRPQGHHGAAHSGRRHQGSAEESNRGRSASRGPPLDREAWATQHHSDEDWSPKVPLIAVTPPAASTLGRSGGAGGLGEITLNLTNVDDLKDVTDLKAALQAAHLALRDANLRAARAEAELSGQKKMLEAMVNKFSEAIQTEAHAVTQHQESVQQEHTLRLASQHEATLMRGELERERAARQELEREVEHLRRAAGLPDAAVDYSSKDYSSSGLGGVGGHGAIGDRPQTQPDESAVAAAAGATQNLGSSEAFAASSPAARSNLVVERNQLLADIFNG